MTTTSFTLTKEMREKLADQLTGLAIAKHAPKIGAILKKLNASYWDEHLVKVDGILKLDRARHAELIQAGIVTAASTAVPAVENIELIRIAEGSRGTLAEQIFDGLKMVLRSDAYQKAGVSDFLKTHRYSHAYSLTFKSDSGSVPRLNDMEKIEPSNKLVSRAQKVGADLVAICLAAHEFKSKTVDILNSCRTSRQLVDLFPEAAKLLPEPVKRNTELAPVDLVNSVREQLKTGVPNIAA